MNSRILLRNAKQLNEKFIIFQIKKKRVKKWKKKIFHENQAAAKNLHWNESQRTLEMFTISLGYFSMAKHKKGD